ncbi:MAG TPA: amidohydrolase family protein [Ramlibacter sp.]|nr:amidohydrolase family protein [Ramlibacter sp.]
MSHDEREPPPFRGNRYRATLALREWHARAPAEPVLEPGLPIVDAHHHLYGSAEDAHFYRVEDMAQDVASGHRVIGTAYVEAYQSAWRLDGPPGLRSLGEVEMIAALAARSLPTPHGPCQLAAAVVSNVDLTLADDAAPVLQAHLEAGQGRLRGVRHSAHHVAGRLGEVMGGRQRHLLSDANFRRGLAHLGRWGLSFNASIFHTQIPELAELADAFPNTPIILNHLGTVLGVEEFSAQRATVFADWRRAMRALARRPNVWVKVGGMGMPIFGFGFEGQDRPARSETLARAWQPFIDTCVDAFGTGRCMFESNFPVDKQSCGYVELWNAFKLATRAFSADERSDLFHRTACRAYGLPALERLASGEIMIHGAPL